jgi:hypothetical protein
MNWSGSVTGGIAVSHLPGSAPGACFAHPRSPRLPPFAPPAPPRIVQLCSLASSLLWLDQTPRSCSSSATAPRLPDADQYGVEPTGQMRDLPVPAQRPSPHAMVFDHAEPPGARASAPAGVAFRDLDGVGTPKFHFFRGSLAGLCNPRSTLRHKPHDLQRTTRADAARYSFIAMDFHHLVLAGLPAPSRDACCCRLAPAQFFNRTSGQPYVGTDAARTAALSGARPIFRKYMVCEKRKAFAL